MTEAEHNRPIPKLFDNWPSASAAEVFCETIGLVIYKDLFIKIRTRTVVTLLLFLYEFL